MTEKTYQEADRLQISIKRIESIIHDFACANYDEVSSDLYVLLDTNSSFRIEGLFSEKVGRIQKGV